MLSTFAAAVLLWSPQAPDQALAPGTKLAFRAQTLAGAEVGADDLIGRPTVLILWGPWSAPSSRALEVGRALKERYGERVRYVALASWDTLQNVAAFRDANPTLDLEYWWDPAAKNTADSIAVKVFKTRRFPTVYVASRDARIVGGFVGFKASDDVAALVDKALQ